MADASGTHELLRVWAGEVVARGTDLMTTALRDAAPLGATGETRRQITGSVDGGGDTPGANFTAPTPQGEYVEKGTEPHIIVPRNAKVLRFEGGSGRISQPGPNQRIATRAGGVVFTTEVHHPGTPARPWFEPTVQRWGEMLAQAAGVVSVSG